jgi:hypothetical protein
LGITSAVLKDVIFPIYEALPESAPPVAPSVSEQDVLDVANGTFGPRAFISRLRSIGVNVAEKEG